MLTPREEQIVIARFAGATYAELASSFGIGRERISQILRRAEAKLQTRILEPFRWIEDAVADALGNWNGGAPKSRRVFDLELSVRASNVCIANRIYTLADLAKYRHSDLLRLQQCGRVTIDELCSLMRENGSTLADRCTTPFYGHLCAS